MKSSINPLLDKPGMSERLQTALADMLAQLPEFQSYPPGLYADPELSRLMTAGMLLTAIDTWLMMAQIAADVVKDVAGG